LFRISTYLGCHPRCHLWNEINGTGKGGEREEESGRWKMAERRELDEG
jgi:hypothetical protein